MTSRGTWKNLERETARLLHGVRILRSGNAGIKGDVLHSRFFIDCKYSSKKSLRLEEILRKAEEQSASKVPLVVSDTKNNHKGAIVSLRLLDFVNVIDVAFR